MGGRTALKRRARSSDTLAITLEDENSEEERFVTIGMNALAQILIVVFTWRGETIRVISARKATAHERAQYEDQSYER